MPIAHLRDHGNYVDAFTPEVLNGMVIKKNLYAKFLRLNDKPYFGVQRTSENTWVWLFIASGSLINGAKAHGRTCPQYQSLPGTMEEAMKEADRLYAELKPLAIRKVRGGHFFRESDGAVVDHLFADKEPVDDPRYEPLMTVLMDAYNQAASGKGADRHGGGLDFMDQHMMKIADITGVQGPMYQAIKKLVEGRKLEYLKAREEYLGAMVYIAGMIAWLDNKARASDRPA